MTYNRIRPTAPSPLALILGVALGAAAVAGCNKSAPPAENTISASIMPLTADEAKFFKAVEAGDVTQVQETARENPDILKVQGELGTPLHVACSGAGDAEVTAALLKAGADPNAQDDRGNTPLNIAVRGKTRVTKTRIIDLLLRNGANPDAKTRGGGSTPLHIAAFAGNVDAVKLLIAHKADINATDGEGKTPLQRVTAAEAKLRGGDKNTNAISRFFDMQNYPQIIALLQKAGGKA